MPHVRDHHPDHAVTAQILRQPIQSPFLPTPHVGEHGPEAAALTTGIPNERLPPLRNRAIGGLHAGGRRHRYMTGDHWSNVRAHA
jgi:hypothetical protein